MVATPIKASERPKFIATCLNILGFTLQRDLAKAINVNEAQISRYIHNREKGEYIEHRLVELIKKKQTPFSSPIETPAQQKIAPQPEKEPLPKVAVTSLSSIQKEKNELLKSIQVLTRNLAAAIEALDNLPPLKLISEERLALVEQIVGLDEKKFQQVKSIVNILVEARKL